MPSLLPDSSLKQRAYCLALPAVPSSPPSNASRPPLPAGAEVVAVLHDAGQPYLDTIYNDSWVCENFDISPAELAARIEGSAQ